MRCTALPALSKQVLKKRSMATCQRSTLRIIISPADTTVTASWIGDEADSGVEKL